MIRNMLYKTKILTVNFMTNFSSAWNGCSENLVWIQCQKFNATNRFGKNEDMDKIIGIQINSWSQLITIFLKTVY